jgi:hypothetical protein
MIFDGNANMSYGFVGTTNVGANVKVATTPKIHKDGKLFSLTKRFCASINDKTPVFLPFTDMKLTGDGFGGGQCHSNVESLLRQRGVGLSYPLIF